MSKKTSRELRCEPQNWELDENKKNDVLKFKDGNLGWNVSVQKNKLSFDLKTSEKNTYGCYPDDAIARIRDILISFGGDDENNKNAIQYLQLAIDELDKRAVKKHGYSNSKEEQMYIPPFPFSHLKCKD